MKEYRCHRIITGRTSCGIRSIRILRIIRNIPCNLLTSPSPRTLVLCTRIENQLSVVLHQLGKSRESTSQHFSTFPLLHSHDPRSPILCSSTSLGIHLLHGELARSANHSPIHNYQPLEIVRCMLRLYQPFTFAITYVPSVCAKCYDTIRSNILLDKALRANLPSYRILSACTT